MVKSTGSGARLPGLQPQLGHSLSLALPSAKWQCEEYVHYWEVGRIQFIMQSAQNTA